MEGYFLWYFHGCALREADKEAGRESGPGSVWRRFRSGENPVTAIRELKVLPSVKAKVQHHDAPPWQEVPARFAELQIRSAMAAKALQFTILTACRTSEVLEMKWPEVDFDARLWTTPAELIKGGQVHRVPLNDEKLAILEPLRALATDYVFEGQKRHQPLSNISMLMPLRRMRQDGVTMNGFRRSFRDWAAEAANAPRRLAEAVFWPNTLGPMWSGLMRGGICWKGGEN